MSPSQPGDGYHAFLDAAREIEQIVRAHPGASDLDVAAGYAYLAGMWQFHLERATKSDDVDHPCFVRDMDSARSWGLPTPDHHYYSAQIDGAGTYRVQGHRGNVTDYCIEVLTGLFGDDGTAGRRIAALEAGAIAFDAEGRFELFVGGDRRAGNWLPSHPDATAIFVRQTVSDWDAESATPMLIERIDRPCASFRRLTNEAVQQRLQRAARRLVAQVRALDALARHWTQVLPTNELPPPAVGPADAGYFPGQFNTRCRFDFAPGEALLLALPPAIARYQSVSLGHPLWFNSLDPRHRSSTLNLAQSHVSPDGGVRYVVCDRDPGVLNWLDTGGLTTGFLFVRYQQVAEGAPVQPTMERLPLATLASTSAQSLSACTPVERAEAARRRRLGLDRRFF